MTDFLHSSITEIDEIESFFTVHRCDSVVQHYLETIKVPNTVTLTKFRDGNLTEYRFTGKREDVEVIWDYVRFDIVLPVDWNERTRDYSKFNDRADGFLHIRLEQRKQVNLVEMRIPYDGVYFTVDVNDPMIYHVTGKFFRLKAFHDWFKSRFPEKPCW